MGERDRGHRVSCVFPARNEALSLARTVAEWADVLPSVTRDHEIIVVDDGSTDDTLGVLRELSSHHPRLRVVSHGRHRGYGAAIASGFAHATLPLLFFTDADGQYDPRDLAPLLDGLARADIVAGYRLRRADPPLRRVLSGGYNAATRLLVGVSLRDLNCAFKAMDRETFERLAIEGTGFLFNAELVLRARDAGLIIAEVPVRHRPRMAGRSTVGLRHVASTLHGLLRLRARRLRRAPTIRPFAP